MGNQNLNQRFHLEKILNAHFARMLSLFHLPLSSSEMQVSLVSDLQQVLKSCLSSSDQQNTRSLEDERTFFFLVSSSG